jgi:arylsulfatase A
MEPLMKNLLLAFAGLILTFAPLYACPNKTPNIVVIYADDLGYGDVGCYNSESKVPTPNIDQLAAEGMRFTDAHSPSTVCTPSRYSVMTGRMAFRLDYRGVFTGVGGPCLITSDRLTLPEMLRQKGYTTAMFGKWHIGMRFLDEEGRPVYESGKGGTALVNLVDFSRRVEDGPLDHGFDEFFGTACCPTTDWLYAYIDGDRLPNPPTELLDREKESLPQHPYSRDNRRGMIAADFDLQEVDMVFLEKSLDFLERQASDDSDKPFFLFHSAQAVHLPSFAGREFQGRTEAGPHGDFIFEFDQVVGRLMEALERLNLANDTLVIVCSDNGPEVGTTLSMRTDHNHDGANPWRGVKRDQWEGGHRTPFIVHWPGKVEPGSVCDQTICQTDIMSTCAAITGYNLPQNAAEDSFNILPALLGEDEDEPIRPFTLHQTISLALAVRQGPWKYLDHQGSGGNNYDSDKLRQYALPDTAPEAPGQLYNLDMDPGETTNLYFEHPEIVERLRAILGEAKTSGRSRP